jgi:hypothetical protein
MLFWQSRAGSRRLPGSEFASLIGSLAAFALEGIRCSSGAGSEGMLKQTPCREVMEGESQPVPAVDSASKEQGTGKLTREEKLQIWRQNKGRHQASSTSATRPRLFQQISSSQANSRPSSSTSLTKPRQPASHGHASKPVPRAQLAGEGSSSRQRDDIKDEVHGHVMASPSPVEAALAAPSDKFEPALERVGSVQDVATEEADSYAENDALGQDDYAANMGQRSLDAFSVELPEGQVAGACNAPELRGEVQLETPIRPAEIPSSDEEEEVAVEELQLQLFDTSNRLAQCTALLQRVVEENSQLRVQLGEFNSLKEKCELLESSVGELRLLHASDEFMSDEPTLTTDVEGESSSRTLRSSAKASGSKDHGAQDEHNTVRSKRQKPDGFSDSAEESEQGQAEGSLTRTEHMEIAKLRKALEDQRKEFAAERQRHVEKLMNSEQRARAAEAAMMESNVEWQKLFDSQMKNLQAQLQQALQHKTGASHPANT